VQVLDLSRCGIKDSGGAAICTALLQQDSICELHLSWNALSNMTAKALEVLLRYGQGRLWLTTMTVLLLTSAPHDALTAVLIKPNLTGDTVKGSADT